MMENQLSVNEVEESPYATQEDVDDLDGFNQMVKAVQDFIFSYREEDYEAMFPEGLLYVERGKKLIMKDYRHG